MTNLPVFIVNVAPSLTGNDNITLSVSVDDQYCGLLVLPARAGFVLLNVLFTCNKWMFPSTQHIFFLIKWNDDFTRRKLAEMYVRCVERTKHA